MRPDDPNTGGVRVKFLAQEHNIMAPVRTCTWAAGSGVQCTNHKANAPLTLRQKNKKYN